MNELEMKRMQLTELLKQIQILKKKNYTKCLLEQLEKTNHSLDYDPVIQRALNKQKSRIPKPYHNQNQLDKYNRAVVHYNRIKTY